MAARGCGALHVAVLVLAAGLAAGAAAAQAASAVEGLEPAILWAQFGALSAIPHPSGHLDGTRAYLLDWASAAGLDAQVDDAGNVYIFRPGANGGEDAAPIVLQAHMDMVGTAADPSFDFKTTPITLVVEGDWVHANGTTLGADDGIGEAAILALLGAAADEAHGPVAPLVGLFTVDEETSLSGAWGANATLLAGASSLVNLDSEVLGQVIVGSAGGFQFFIHTTADLEAAPPDVVPLGLHITGLKGGHSGVNIGEGGANAIKLCGAVLSQIQQEIPGSCLLGTQDGTAMNAIPTECKALVAVPSWQVNATAALAAQAQADFLLEYGTNEPGLAVTAAPLAELNASAAAQWAASPACLSRRGTDALVGLILNIYSGPLKYSQDLPGLVETSNALTVVAAEPRYAANRTATGLTHTLECYPRSSVEPELGRILDQHARLAHAFGATLNNTWPFLPAWQYDADSQLTNLTATATTEVLGSADVTAVHGGLECSILLQRMEPGSSAVSFGPTIEHAHSASERVSISSVQAFWDILGRLVDALSAQEVAQL